MGAAGACSAKLEVQSWPPSSSGEGFVHVMHDMHLVFTSFCYFRLCIVYNKRRKGRRINSRFISIFNSFL